MSPGAVVLACLVAAVAGGVVGGVIASALNGPSSGATASSPPSSASSPPSSTGSTTAAAQPQSCPVTKIAEDDLPSVVTISVKGKSAGGTGSGEIIRADGYILTNNHVIAAAASGGSISVLFSNGKAAAATLVGRDPLTDVAVIKVSNQGSLPAIPLGSSSTLVVGQPVVVLGAPLGLSSTVTSGIVSALDRTIQVPGENSQAALLIDAIQTDAAINPGNSGGSLVNCSGQFVGMPSAGASLPNSGQSAAGSIGLGFAIPADQAIREAGEIISTGRVAHSYLGLQASPVSADAAAVNGVAEGVRVTGIDAAGPAQEAGLRTGDTITTIAGQPAVSTDQLVALTLGKRPGDQVEIGYERNGSPATATVTLGAQP